MGLAFLLVAVAFFAAFVLVIVGIGYLAVRDHFNEIPLSRWGAIAASSFVAVGLGAAWLTLGSLGFALGQMAGNGNLGSLIGGLTGIVGWVVTSVAYGWRISRRLAELQLIMRPTRQTPSADTMRVRRRWLTAIFVVTVAIVAIAAYTALNRPNGP